MNATTVAIEGHGILVRGPSGAGKSDLALRLIEDGAQLIADDYTDIEIVGLRLVARAPRELAGLLEVRGLGVLRLPQAPFATLVACVDLVRAETVERTPPALSAPIGATGRTLPLFRLAPFEPSAAAKVRLAVRLCTGSILRRT